MKNFNILLDLKEIQNPSSKETGKHTHSIHPYPAKYIPQIPNRIISEFTNERHVVLDPFCGSGTSLLEAKLLGRESIGIDLNPIAALTSRVKTYCITKQDELYIELFLVKLEKLIHKTPKKNLWIPPAPNIDHWFTKEAILGLSAIVDLIRNVEVIEVRRILNLALSTIIVNVSNQESETRFAAKTRDISYEQVLKLYISKLTDITRKLSDIAKFEKFKLTDSNVHLGSLLNADSFLKKHSVDLVVTSPPYLNSFDYYLYHKFRIYWLSYPENIEEVIPVVDVQKEEIGSRYKFSGPNGDNVLTFKQEMEKCFSTLNMVLKPSKLLFLVVGDSIVKGDFFKMDDYYDTMLSSCGFKLVSKVSYPMSGASRSFISANYAKRNDVKKESHILAFESLNSQRTNGEPRERIIVPSAFTPTKNVTEVSELPKQISSGANFFINNNKVTELTHGLIKYPAKYIPQIPRWAIQNYTKPGDTVLDPFNGSGTSAVEAYTSGRNYYGYDVNPIAILGSKVKTTYISKVKIDRGVNEFLDAYKKNSKKKKHDGVTFELQEFWFDPKVLGTLFNIKSSIDAVKNTDVKNMLLITLSSIIKKVSYLDEGQLKVKRDSKKVINGIGENVFDFFMKRLDRDKKLIEKLQDYKEESAKVELKVKSAFNLDSLQGKNTVDLIVTSPPYINAMNYPMYHRYELLILGLISPDEYIEHQTEYFGTERVYAKDYKEYKDFEVNGVKFKKLNEKLKKIHTGEPKRYFIAKKYFEDMAVFLGHSHKILKKGKKLILVCGTNTIKGVPINTALVLSEIAQVIGFKEDFHFSYEIRKHRFKLTRHSTAGKINNDIIVTLTK